MKMMSYRYDNKKKRYGYLAGVIVIIILFFTPFLSTAFDVLEKPLLTAWNQSGENIQKVEGFFARFYSKQKLHEKNQLLQQRIGILEVDILRTEYLQSILGSYEQLNKQEQEVIPAQIIVRAPLAQQDTFVIDIGMNQGVQVGDIVIAEHYLLLGEVIEVFDISSRVRLLTKNAVSTPSVTYPHAESIEVIGSGSSFEAQVSRDSLVQVGDVVFSQAQPGYVIAVVREIVFDNRDPYKKVYLSLPIDLSRVQVVGVLKSE